MEIYIILWLVLCIIAGAIGKNKNVGFWGGFLYSFFLSPLIGLIIVAVSDSKKRPIPGANLVVKYVREGDKSLNEKDYYSAIDSYKKVLGITKPAPKTHFKLAYIYSIQKNKELAFKHLQFAIEQGYNNLQKLQQEGFDYLRKQPEYASFKSNGFKFEEKADSSNIDKLERLAKLKKDGLITEEEFLQEKEKILAK